MRTARAKPKVRKPLFGYLKWRFEGGSGSWWGGLEAGRRRLGGLGGSPAGVVVDAGCLERRSYW